MAAYCRHYATFGKAEGRNASADGQAMVSVAAPAGNTAGEQPTAPAGRVIGTRTTTYDANIPRANNVVLAAQRVNGTVLQPGQGFSFNKAVLPRTRANGYVEATIFISGELGTGIGGGICQVSSTLYASMIDAGLLDR